MLAALSCQPTLSIEVITNSLAVPFSRNFPGVHFAIPLLHAVQVSYLHVTFVGYLLKLRYQDRQNGIETFSLPVIEIHNDLLSRESMEDFPGCV